LLILEFKKSPEIEAFAQLRGYESYYFCYERPEQKREHHLTGVQESLPVKRLANTRVTCTMGTIPVFNLSTCSAV
jgi:hypothetical protein